jgi:hypothetical protein
MKRLSARRMGPWREWPLIESLFVAAFLCMLAIALLSAVSLTRQVLTGRIVVTQLTR